MFDPQNVPKDLMMNGSYYCFAKLGEYYGVGQTFVVILLSAPSLDKLQP